MAIRIGPAQIKEVEAKKEGVRFSEGFTFRLRQHLTGNFHGLWELTLLDEKGKVAKVISDADGLNYCIDNMMGVLEDEGL